MIAYIKGAMLLYPRQSRALLVYRRGGYCSNEPCASYGGNSRLVTVRR